MSAITLVTTCKGRLAHLRDSLPRMAAQADAEVVVVDYGCPEQAGDWAQQHFPQVRVVRVEGAQGFSAARARNAGAAAAQTPWLAFVDADIVLAPQFAQEVLPTLVPGHFYRPVPLAPDAWGTCIVAREDFAAIGGYDEVLRSWGGDDDDLYYRLARLRGCRQGSFPGTLLQPIAHSDAARVAWSEDGAARWVSQRANALYLHVKYDLMRTLGQAELSSELRTRMYDEVRRTVTEDAAKGAATTRIDITLPTEPQVPLWGWRLTRTWRFQLDRIEGAPESPFAGQETP
ncbi:MAG: glycosyltransferase family 2 protein [Ignavibacteria bacterium]